MLGTKWRIWQEKILLLLRIKKHDKSTLCRQVYEKGRANGWPGLGVEVTDICNELEIPDANDVEVSKAEVKKAIFDHHYNSMKKEMEESKPGSKKLNDIEQEDFREVQDYFHYKSVDNGRMAFKVRCQMVPDIPGNLKGKYNKKGSDDMCPLP